MHRQEYKLLIFTTGLDKNEVDQLKAVVAQSTHVHSVGKTVSYSTESDVDTQFDTNLDYLIVATINEQPEWDDAEQAARWSTAFNKQVVEGTTQDITSWIGGRFGGRRPSVEVSIVSQNDIRKVWGL